MAVDCNQRIEAHNVLPSISNELQTAPGVNKGLLKQKWVCERKIFYIKNFI